MNQSERQTRRVQLESWEVGGELLDILSRGLYSDAKDALREYVQNGVDAEAGHILITVDGSQAVIRDDGCGMNEEGIRVARRFGMSEKSPREMVGYRGIGIYSAFGICEEMTITSKQVGMKNLVGWTFQFGEMRRLLEADKASDARQGVGLPDLMYQYSELFVEPYYGDVGEHFTVVELDGLGDEYRAQLNNAAGVNDYLLSTIPVAFSEDGYGEKVNGWLEDNVKLNPVRITLRIADESEVEVFPPVATGVYSPESDWIKAPDGTALAFVWYALSANGKQLPMHEGSEVSGFLLKVKGFTLGDRLALKGLWPAVGGGTLYHHYTGEVHILATDQIYPNAARNDLESSPARQLFAKQAEDFFFPLSRKARAMQATIRADRLLEGIDNTIEQLRKQEDAPNSDSYEVYRNSENYRKELENVHQQIATHRRKPRGRPRVQFDDVQQGLLDNVVERLQSAISQLGGVARAAQRSTERKRRKATQPPPQEMLLKNVLSAALRIAEETGDVRYKKAAEALVSSINTRSVTRAIGVLDELKATGVDLSSELESSRRELRTILGWSPLAPVSLGEGLAQQGIALEGKQLECLINAIDRGLVVGLGGRGERYETVLRAIVEAIAEEMGS